MSALILPNRPSLVTTAWPTYEWFVLPDIQAPLHDKKALRAVLDHIKVSGYHGIICVGDEIDLPSVSRWTSGRAGEGDRRLRSDLTITHDIMREFREALGPDKPFHVVRSNHGDRIRNYVEEKAMALGELVAPGEVLDISKLLRYPELGITYHYKPFEFEPGWVLCHGDEGGGSQVPGGVALGLAKRWAKSVVCGHTHKAGVLPYTVGFDNKMKVYWGMEAGNLMDMSQATYLKSGWANWQHAFGTVRVEMRGRRRIITPQVHYLVNGEVQRDPFTPAIAA